MGPRSQVPWQPGLYPVGPVGPVFVGLLAPALWPFLTPQLGTPPHSPSAPPASVKHLDWKKRHHQSPQGFLLKASVAALLTPTPPSQPGPSSPQPQRVQGTGSMFCGRLRPILQPPTIHKPHLVLAPEGGLESGPMWYKRYLRVRVSHPLLPPFPLLLLPPPPAF